MSREAIKVLLLALASGVVGVAVVATLTDGPLMQIGTAADTPGPAPAPGRAATGGSTAATSHAYDARPAGEPGPRDAFGDERYLVRAGDTLWGLATRYYEDASAGMARIKRRNGLRRDTLLAGEILVLPAAGRRSDGSGVAGTCPTDEVATTTSCRPAP